MINAKKRCIFHLPNYINPNGKSGSQVRPMKMKEAFESIGYEVDFIMGYGKERKRKIREVKSNIKKGIRYEFCYSESSTMPTLLTERNHFPRFPTLDFGFIKFCRKNDIKIGLFYRDVFWKFEQYKKAVPWYQKIVTIPFYKYDLHMYNKLLDVLYLPSDKMKKYVKECKTLLIKYLPPGSDYNSDCVEKRKEYFCKRDKKDIHIFYVGGVSGIYDIIDFLKSAQNKEYLWITICCKKEEWMKEKERYQPYLTERIKVVHAFGKELEQYYAEADICSCYFDTERHAYMKMATPIKLLEYMSHVTPVLATQGSNAAEFIERYGIGWETAYSETGFTEWIEELYEHQEVIVQKHIKAVECLEKNTWAARALQVEKDLERE